MRQRIVEVREHYKLGSKHVQLGWAVKASDILKLFPVKVRISFRTNAIELGPGRRRPLVSSTTLAKQTPADRDSSTVEQRENGFDFVKRVTIRMS